MLRRWGHLCFFDIDETSPSARSQDSLLPDSQLLLSSLCLFAAWCSWTLIIELIWGALSCVCPQIGISFCTPLWRLCRVSKNVYGWLMYRCRQIRRLLSFCRPSSEQISGYLIRSCQNELFVWYPLSASNTHRGTGKKQCSQEHTLVSSAELSPYTPFLNLKKGSPPQ